MLFDGGVDLTTEIEPGQVRNFEVLDLSNLGSGDVVRLDPDAVADITGQEGDRLEVLTGESEAELDVGDGWTDVQQEDGYTVYRTDAGVELAVEQQNVGV